VEDGSAIPSIFPKPLSNSTSMATSSSGRSSSAYRKQQTAQVLTIYIEFKLLLELKLLLETDDINQESVNVHLDDHDIEDYSENFNPSVKLYYIILYNAE
jgi:hypothetical protein